MPLTLASFLQVKADKEREVRDGHDGTWVAHPALVGVALDIFNAGMRTPNQVYNIIYRDAFTTCINICRDAIKSCTNNQTWFVRLIFSFGGICS